MNRKARWLGALVVVLVASLILPSTALGFNWVKSPVSPLIKSGVHSKAKFKSLMLKNSKVRGAVRGVIKRDKLPYWVFDSAMAEVKAGRIYGTSLARGTNVGWMAFGPGTTKYERNTIWKGKGRLTYYYVVASKTVIENGWRTTTSYRVCLATTCANPFVFYKKSTRTRVSPPELLYNLYVEKRLNSVEGELLGDWQISGNVGGEPVSVTTTDTGPILVGQYAEGTAYDLTELLKQGWEIVSPTNGTTSGVMPAADVTITFVNRRHVDPPVLYNLYVEKRQDSLEGTRLADWKITGTVGESSVDVTTSADAPILVGQFEAGTPYDLSELLKQGWQIVSPANGTTSGVMPAEDLTITFVNSQVPTESALFLTKGFWHNDNGMAILEQHPEWITYVNGLAPYSGSPFADLSQVSAYLIADNSGGDPKIQLGQQLLAFIFNVKNSGATHLLVNGEFVSTQSIIDEAIAAWIAGGDTANAMSTKLDGYNQDVWQTVIVGP
jgi:hypothetical protein